MKKALIPFALLFLIILSLIFYYNRFTPITTIKIDGYAFDSDDITSNLLNGFDSSSNKITFTKVTNNDTLYQSGNRYYVGIEGKDRKDKIELEYPIISLDSSSLMTLNNNGYYIDEFFNKTTIVFNSIITNKHIYNGNNFIQLDDIDYYFMEMSNGTFINLDDLSIDVEEKHHLILANSFINFGDDYIRFYSLKENDFIYQEIPFVKDDSKVKISNFEGTYRELLKKIGFNELYNDVDFIEDINGNIQKNNSKIGNGDRKTNLDVHYLQEDYSDLWGGKTYIKPEVSISDISTSIYSLRANLSIYDPANVIIKSPVFTFKTDDRVYLRQTFNRSDSVIVKGLLPSTSYNFDVSYVYYNEKAQKIQKIVYEGIIDTLAIDNVEDIDISFDSIVTYINSFDLNGIRIKNNENDEVLNGIKQIEISYGEVSNSLSIQNVRNLVALGKVDFASPSILNSNTFYNGQIVVKDVADNILKVNGGEFSFTTKKALPIASVNVESGKQFTNAIINFSINNIDNINVRRYYYVLFNTDGEEVIREVITENTKKREITNLESGKKYYIGLYCDYIDEDDNEQNNVQIASTEFVTYDVTRLGKVYLDIRYGNVTEASQEAYISYKNTDEMFTILYDMLDEEVTLNVINSDSNTIDYSETFTKGNFRGLGSKILLDKLTSNTNYRIEMQFFVTSGDNKVAINVDYGNKNSFKTLKLTPGFYVENLFISDGYIDFDAIVYDKDSAIILSDSETSSNMEEVVLDVYDSSNSRVYSQNLSISTGILTEENPTKVNRITLDNLESNETYIFKVVAKSYNNGLLSVSNYEVPKTRKYVLSGSKGVINLNKLIKTTYYDVYRGSAEGKNMFDIANRARWKESGDTATVGRLKVDIDNNVISLLAQNGYRQYNYYLPEVYQSDGEKSVTISFDVRRETGTSTDFCLINGTATNCNGANAYKILDVDEEYQHIDITIPSVEKSGYITFFIGEQKNKNLKTIFDIKDLQIILGEEASSSFNSFENSSEYVGLFDISLDEMPTSEIQERQILENDNETYDSINNGIYDVFVRIECIGEKCPKTNDSKFLIENKLNISELPTLFNEEIDGILSDTNYIGYLSFYDSFEDTNRYYDVSKVYFASDAEIRTISNADEFFGMHTNGYYVAINDIDLTNDTRTYSGTFQGTLDFQGHKLFLDNKKNYRMDTLGGSGVFKNVDIHYDLIGREEKDLINYYGLFYTLNGKLSNVKISLDTCPDRMSHDTMLIARHNFGIIENFVIHTKAPLIGKDNLALGVLYNFGIIKNGYAYGENIKAIYSANTLENNNTNKNVGVFAVNNSAGSVIKNVYSLVDIIINDNPTDLDKIAGSIVANSTNSVVKNAITFNIEDNPTRDLTKDNMFGKTSGLTASNLYYISSNNYSDAFSKQIMAKTINDPLFLDNIINEEAIFDTANAFKNKIFPHVIWPDNMPTQDYLIIPTQEEEKNLALISVDEVTYLENDPDYSAKILLTIHNNSLLKITGIEIEGINKIDIVDQALNRNGKTTLLYAMIGYPDVYKSNYVLNKIKSNVIEVSSDDNISMNLYYPVNNLQEIHDLINTHENFMLTRDIDCLKEECPTTKLAKVKGRINGRNHTISNFTANGCYINELNGFLENIIFEKYKAGGNLNNSGLICTMSGATVRNVFMVDEELTIGYVSNNDKNIKAGGIAAVAKNSLIEDSGINGLKLQDKQIGGSVIIFGGMSGSTEYLSVENCFVRRLQFNVRKEVDASSQQGGNANSNNSGGIGGIIGTLTYGNISNSYTTGKIDTDMGVAGGIVGINQNGYLDSVIGFVKIVSSQDDIGGIAGRVISNTSPARDSSISKSIAMGAVSTVLDNPNNFGRTSGTQISINGNFVWDKQAVNSRISNNTDGETLLSTADLSNSIIYLSKIGFSSKNFALTENFVPGFLPFIRGDDGSILYGQGFNTNENVDDREIKYDEGLSYISSDIRYEYASGYENDENRMYYATSANAKIKLKNPNYYQIKSIEIPDINVQNLSASTDSEGITTLSFTAIPYRYYDNYNISKITYLNASEEETIFPIILIEMTFYKKIASVSDWNGLIKGSLENYFFDQDLDFQNSINCNYSLSFNNLVGVPRNGLNPKIKNIGTDSNPLIFKSAGDALIDTISAGIQDITFENIYIKNNSKSGNYTGIIKFLNGLGNNINFENVSIDAQKNSYVGIISYNQSPDFRNITMNNITVKGITYVGGLIGRSLSRDVTNVKADGITIEATGNYVGGLIGYEVWDSKRVHTYQVDAKNISVVVTGSKSYTGGIFGYGAGNEIKISNSYIEGYNRVGGISGQDGNSSIQYNYVINCNIVGSGSYIGGATGVNTTRYYTYVKDTNVGCKTDDCTTSYVGGISGGGNWYTILYSGVSNSTINGGTAVGGIKGLIGYTNIYGDYVKDTTVTGNINVGGIAGETSQRYNYIYLNTTNATVVAKSSSAGAILGYGHNLYSSSTEERIHMYRNIVANSTVTALEYAGGLIGKVDKELFAGHIYSNVISANVSCTANDNCLAGYVIGTNDEYATEIKNLRLYENSTLKVGTKNAVKLIESNTVPNYFVTNTTMINRTKLSEIKTYTASPVSFSTSYYEAVNNKFPRLKVSQAEYRVEFDLPMANPLLTGFMATRFHVMPNVSVYAVDIDKINIEFDYIDENTFFVINDKVYNITKKTYTFYYNFLEDFTIRMYDDISEKEIIVKHDELKNSVIIDGNSYYIIDKDGNIISNNDIDINKTEDEPILGDINYRDNLISIPRQMSVKLIDNDIDKHSAVNIYNGKILLDNGNVYDIENDEVILNYVDNLTIVEESKPIYEYNYDKQKIQTFENYSLVDGKYITKRIIIRDGQIEILSNELLADTSSVLVGYYNGKNYLVYLDDGSIHSVKEKIVYPNSFVNYGIAEISFDKKDGSSLIFVKYKNNDYVLFDYQTGEVLLEKNDYVPDLLEYVKNFFKPNNNHEITKPKYENAKSLINNIIEKNSESNINAEYYENSKYTVSYNPRNDTYEVYQIPNQLSSNSDIASIVSSDSLSKRIANSSELAKIYNYNSGIRYNWIPAVIIMVTTLMLIVVSVMILWKNIKKNN